MVEEKNEDWTFSIKDLTEKQHVTFTGRGEYFVGLTQACALAVERDVDNLCVPLLHLTINNLGGCVIACGNKDFPCGLSNGEALSGEVTLVTGLVLDIADRQLQFFEGPIPKPRRKLPRTPGAFIQDTPPSKPARRTDHEHQNGEETETGKENKHEENEQSEIQPHTIERRMSEDPHFELQSPEQVAIAAASHFIKQLRMFTDANVTSKMVDDVFKLFVDTVESCPEVFEMYVREMASGKSVDRPMHAPAVRVIIEMLKYTLDPVERVVLILDLLRTFSHFDANLPTLVQLRASATVLGTMTALRDVVEVQRYGADILAKIALYQPRLDEKPTIREVAVDVLLAAVRQLKADLQLARSVSRCMANLASSITQLLNNSIDRLAEDSERSSPLSLNCVSTYEKLLQHVFKEAIPVVQTSMKQFNTDVGVCTEGRKLIFFYGKFPQLEQKLSSLQQVCREPISEDIDDISAQWNTDTDILLVESWKQKPSGIMRSKGRPVKQEGKKIKFVDLERSDNADNDSNDYENDTSGSDNEMRGLKVNGMAPNDATKANGNHETQVRDSVPHKYVINSDQLIPVVEQQIEHDFVIINPLETTTNTFSNLPQTENVTTHQEDAPFETDSKQDNGASETTLPFPNEETHFGMRETDTSIEKELHQRAQSESASEDESVTLEQSHGFLPPEVVFLEKLILAQITVYAGTLAFQGNDSQVLMIIDKPVTEMLESVGANAELVAFCKRKHGDTTTLMDVDPSLIISVIDAVRYKSVMTDLVRSTVIDLIKHVSKRMRKPTLEMAYAFLGDIFSNDVIAKNIADDTFLCELHESLQNVNDKLTPAIVEEIQKRCGFPGQKIVNSERSTT